MPMQSRLLTAAACAAGTLVMADGALAQLSVTFAPGTDPAYEQQILQQVQARNARFGFDRYTAGTRWPGAPGSPTHVTWSLVPDGTGEIQPEAGSIQKAGVSDLFFRFDAMFGDRATWLQIFQDSFQQDPTGIETPEMRGQLTDWGNISGLTFTNVVMPPDVSDPENPINFDWDSGAEWDDMGSANGPLSPGGGLPTDPDVGDIRIAGKKIDGFGGVVAYAYGPGDPLFPGEIVLDTQEEWTRSDFQFRFLRNVISRMIGFAIGLEVVCPQAGIRIMEPFDPGWGFTGPQEDDIRGVQALYGDYLENDDDPMSATVIPIGTGEGLLGQKFVHDYRSIDSQSDNDYYDLQIPGDPSLDIEMDVTVTVTPFGSTYDSGPSIDGACGGASTSEVVADSVRDLRIAILDSDLNPIESFDCFSQAGNPQPLPHDVFGWINEGDRGSAECFFTTLTHPGDYYVVIGSFGAGTVDEPQLYSLEMSVGNKIFNNGIGFDTVVLSSAPNGLGVGPIVNLPEGSTPSGQTVYRGSRARVGITEDKWPSLGHITTKYLAGPPPLPTQDFPPQRIAWPGNSVSPPALGGVSSHATAAIACAVGNPVGTVSSAFVGPAFEAPWLAASVGIRNVGASFTVSREALLYGLFGLTDPETALAVGLPDTATVLTNSWGGSGDLRGDSVVSQAFDAVVYMTETPAVVSAGNEGAVDNTPQCGGLGGNSPGSLFRGSRTLAYPSTAFNTISVGMAGKIFVPGEGPPVPELLNPGGTPYELVEDHSSKGPADSYNFETRNTMFNSRPGIDLVSIGTGYLLKGENPSLASPPAPICSYTGHPSIIALSLPTILPSEPDPDHPVPPNDELFASAFGTSFSAPAVAGGIALLQDYALSQTPPVKLHPAVIRAILDTAARPFPGWSNNGNPAIPQDNRDGRDPASNNDVVNRQSTQALDYAQGAGFADINRAMDILKGEYSQDSLAGLVLGAPTTDVAITDPDVATINTPPNEIQLIRPIPRTGAVRAPENDRVAALPKSPIEIADTIADSRRGIPENPIFSPQSDFSDPDIGRVGGDKSAAGVQFSDRTPFKLPPSPNRPGAIPTGPPPVEIAPEDRIVVNPIGWDYAKLGQRVLRLPPRGNFQGGGVPAGYIDYFIAFAFDGVGDTISATLTWLRDVEMNVPDFSNIDDPRIGEIDKLALDNLDLELIQCDAIGNILDDHLFLGVIGQDDGGQIWAFSRSELNNVEHIFTKTVGVPDADDDEIIPAGFYVLRVRWVEGNGFTGKEYDLFNNTAPADVKYGLAWRVSPTGTENSGGDKILTSRASGSLSVYSQRMRVFQMFINAFGKTSNDPDFNPAFDVNHDGAVDVRDFNPILKFWWNR